MRSIFTIIAILSCYALPAQSYTPSYGQELPRSKTIIYPTEEESTAAQWMDSRYLKPLIRWQLQGKIFSTTFTVPFAWANREVMLSIASASSDYEVHLDGKTVAYCANGNLPAEFNLTKVAKEGLNKLEIVLQDSSATASLESWKRAASPAIGRTYVMSQPTMRIRDVFTRTWASDGNIKAEVGIVVKSSALNPKTSRIYYELLTPSNTTVVAGHKDITLDMLREDTIRFIAPIAENLLWDTELPTSYTLKLKTQYEGRYVEYMVFKPGFRTLSVQQGNLSINGRPVTLHLCEVAPDITANDIALLKEQGYNTLKIRAGITPQSLFDLCDLMGMYVIVQTPIDTRNSSESRRQGANPSNDPAWQEAYIERTEQSYYTSKFHPSVIAFSLAENSSNGINLYESYLRLKRIESERSIIYPDAGGEWNTDKLIWQSTPAER